MVVLQTRKALAWHAGRVSRETLLASKSVWPWSSTCNQPKVPEQLPGQSSKSWGGAETMVFISNPPPSSPGGGLNGASDYFCGSAGTRRACPLTAPLGFWLTGLLEIPSLGATWAKSHVRCWSCGGRRTKAAGITAPGAASRYVLDLCWKVCVWYI